MHVGVHWISVAFSLLTSRLYFFFLFHTTTVVGLIWGVGLRVYVRLKVYSLYVDFRALLRSVLLCLLLGSSCRVGFWWQAAKRQNMLRRHDSQQQHHFRECA